jgi:hypothetical protein
MTDPWIVPPHTQYELAAEYRDEPDDSSSLGASDLRAHSTPGRNGHAFGIGHTPLIRTVDRPSVAGTDQEGELRWLASAGLWR